MHTVAACSTHGFGHPAHVHVEPARGERNRLTVAFRVFLALPHLLLVGGPMVAAWTATSRTDAGITYEWGAGGALGAVALAIAFIAWFAILFTGRYPAGLWNLSAFYLRWRVRATSYLMLLRDEYPPFGEGAYPVRLDLEPPAADRDRLSVAFRLILVLPHLIAVGLLGVVWGLTTLFAWFAILFTGEYPERLYDFGVGALRWTTRVEAYLLLLHDDYPPFSLDE